jgi:hypothetical protein
MQVHFTAEDGNDSEDIVPLMSMWAYHHITAHSQTADGEDGFQIWKVATNIVSVFVTRRRGLVWRIDLLNIQKS